MAMKCINFTDGSRLPVFSGNDVDYAQETKVETPHYTITDYIMSDAVITCSDGHGGYINDNLFGKTLTDLDGNTWEFKKDSNGVMNLTITDPDGHYNSFNLESDTGYGPTAWILTCYEYNEDGMTLVVSGVQNMLSMQRSLDEQNPNGEFIHGGYINNWNVEYNFYNDMRLVDSVGEGAGNFGRLATQLRNCFAGGTFCHIQGLYLQGYAGFPEYVNSTDYYFSPFNSVTNRNLVNNVGFSASLSDVDDEKPDPYAPGGSTEPGGGQGNFDDTGDDIDIPTLPTLDATDTGFITLFNPTLSQLQNLANYMWSNLFDIDTFKKIFADPMDCILGLSIVPVSVPNGTTKEVTVGNIPTGVHMTVAAQQYIEVDCGSINVQEHWGGYLDYDPYTKAEIYLPYIGTHPVAVDDIMGKTVTVKYHVDILSGSCTAFVKCGGSVLYEFIGQCTSSIPITGNDWTNVINGALTISSAIGSMIATGGLSAPITANDVTSFASTAMSMKPSVEKSGSMSGTGGMLGVQTPYLILTRPRQALPSFQNSYTGYPSYITENLGSLSGYTEVDSVHLHNIPCTSDELAEIEALLKGGVLL